MNTTKLLITVIFIGLLATSSYFLFSSSESTPEVVANEGPSQDFIEVVRTPSVPCRPLTFTDAHWSVDIQGMNNCSTSVNSTFDVNWQIQQKGPLQPKQYDFIAFSMPHTVRFNGTGFLMLPPQVKLPFGFQFADDQMRVLFPLYLPQSQTTQGTFQIRPLVAGEFTLNWAYLVVNEKGDIVFSSKNTDTAMTFEIQERKNPKLVVQDRVGIEKPEKVLLSPSREYEVRVFEDRFQVLYAKTGELLFERAGKEPNFSPGSRFLGYLAGTNEEGEPEAPLEIIDLLDQKVILNEPYKMFSVAAWEQNDSFLVMGFNIWGAVEIILPLLETNNEFSTTENSHYASAWENSQFAIDLENALFRIRGGDFNLLYSLIWNSDEAFLDQKFGKRYSLTKNSIDNRYYSNTLKNLGFPILRVPPKMWEIEGSFKISHIAGKPQRGMRHFFNNPIVAKNSLLTTTTIASVNQEKTSIRGYSMNRGIVMRLTEDAPSNDISLQNILDRLRNIGLVTQKNHQPSEQNDWQHDVDVKEVVNTLKRHHPRLKGLQKSNILKIYYPQLKGLKLIPKEEECYSSEIGNAIKYQYWNNKGNEFLLAHIVCWDGGASEVNKSGNLHIFNTHKEAFSIQKALLKMYGYEIVDKHFKLDLTTFFQSEIKPFFSEDNILLMVSVDGSSITVFDANKNEVKAFLMNIPESQDIDSLHLSENGKLVLQINEGGRFYLYDIASQQRILNGLYIDDEIVLYTDEGFYDGTREGTYYITWHYPGLKQHFAFNQFESQFKRPDLIKAILNGQPVNKPKVQLLPPPSVEMVLNHAGNYAQQATIELTASSIRSLSNLRVFVDGTPVAEIPVSGRQAQTTVPIELKRGKHWITAVAYNDQGYSSIPERVSVDASKIKAKGSNLYVLGVGIDRYPNLPAQKNLDYAKQDIIAFADTVKANPAQQYDTIVVKQLLDQQATANNIQQALREIIQQATADDTIMLYFAGHGDKGRNDKFYFLTPQAAFTDFETTALAWEKVATLLAQAKAKVVVFLDACHSGVASQETVVPNDEYVTELMKAGKAGMVIIAASKGRQSSREGSQFGGGHGVFNYMITQALTTNRSTTDVNNNGIIELEELYRSVKYNVRKRTNGEQTPWISRNEIIGEMPLL
jgi:hypothetical protein